MDKSNSNWLFILLFQTRFQDMVSVNVNPSTGWFLIWIRVLTITEVSISNNTNKSSNNTELSYKDFGSWPCFKYVFAVVCAFASQVLRDLQWQ